VTLGNPVPMRGALGELTRLLGNPGIPWEQPRGNPRDPMGVEPLKKPGGTPWLVWEA